MKHWAILFPFLISAALAACTANSQNGDHDAAMVIDTPPPPPDTLETFTLAFTGDLMCHDVQFERAKTKDGYDFTPCYAPVKDILSAADFTIGNLETTLPGPKVCCTGYPTFGSPDEYAQAVKDAGFDFVTTSNNHSMDKGWEGVKRTLEVLDTLGLHHTGTYLSQEDQDSIRIYDIKGTKVAILAYTYGTNYIPLPTGKPWAVNMIDDHKVVEEVPAARAAGAELVLVIYHFGKEYRHHPDQYQKNAVDRAVKAGADLVIGGHPHVLQPVDFYQTDSTATLKEGVVAWSLGNFISNQSAHPRRSSIILEIEITRHLETDEMWVSAVNYTPTWVYRGSDPEVKIHKVFPAAMAQDTASLPAWMDKEHIEMMQEAYDSAVTFTSEYSDRVKVKELKKE